jgi:hypothetical protein
MTPIDDAGVPTDLGGTLVLSAAPAVAALAMRRAVTGPGPEATSGNANDRAGSTTIARGTIATTANAASRSA